MSGDHPHADSPPACSTCRVPMVPGVVVDRTDHFVAIAQRWHPGTPTRAKWWHFGSGGVALPDLDQRESLPVLTLRCPKCGRLESYALPLPEQPPAH
ncbi:MAG: hypothetical protein K2Q20_08800 [Phycisphaerales bacterium]|nr:hypothetical protein [Phycisphaerales bacterium]